MLSYLRQGRGFYRSLFALALPIILQNLITESLALADTFMVGALGEAPLAGVTLANIPIYVEQLMIFGFQSGSSVLISQFYGRGDRDAINRVLGIGMYAAGAVTALFGCVMFFFPTQFMSLFGNNAAVVDLAARYVKIVAFSVFFGGLSEVYIAAHRAMGDPKIGLCILGVSMTVNVTLNYGLIFGRLGLPQMGIEGAALATLIARVLQFLLAAGHAVWGKRFRVDPAKVLRPGMAMVRRYIPVAAPVILNETLWGLGTSLYPTIMGHMDNSQPILAAYAVAGNVEKISTVAIFALAAAAAVIVGQSVVRESRERVQEVGRVLNTVAFLSGAVVGVLALTALHLFIRPMVFPIFKLSAEAQAIAAMMLAVTFLSMPFQSFNTTSIVGVLRGGGDVRFAAVIDLSALWLVAIPLAAFVGLVLRWSVLWVCLSRTLEQAVKVVMGSWRSKSGKWIRDVTLDGAG